MSTTGTTTRRSMKRPVHPGEVLREDVLPAVGLSVTEVAEHLGVSRVTLSRVINEHARITANLAVRLEAAGVSTARMWMDLQSAYDLAQAYAAGRPKVRKLETVA